MSSRFVIMSGSAVSEQSKHHILVSDLVRIMRCVSTLCDPSERKSHVQDFMHRMRLSGYDQEQRVSVYKAAKTRYDQQLKNQEDGLVEMYRSKQCRRKQKIQGRTSKQRNWYGDKFDAVYFVNATPGSQLARQCQATFRRCGLSVKVIERTGRTLKQFLVKSDPLSKGTSNA